MMIASIALIAAGSAADQSHAPDISSGGMKASGGRFTLQSEMDGVASPALPVKGGRFTLSGKVLPPDANHDAVHGSLETLEHDPMLLLIPGREVEAGAAVQRGFVLESSDGQKLSATTD